MVFNVGARRSGTLWLQRIVSAHPEVSAVPAETYLFAYGLSQLFDRFQYGIVSSPRVASVYAERDDVLDATRDLCDVVFARFLDPGARMLAERTPYHVHHLELIDALYPDSRVIHIVRDGRDVARSLVSKPWGPATVAAAAREWRAAIEAGRSAEIPAKRYREVRYEDLLADPRHEIVALYEWLGLPATDEVIDTALAEAAARANLGADGSVGTGKWRRAWTRAEVRAFDRVAGETLAELGYERDLRAASPSPRRLAARALRRMRRLRRGEDPRHAAPAAAPDPSPTRPQQLIERVVELVENRRIDELAELSAPDARFKVVDGKTARAAAGKEGLRMLAEALADGAGGQQVRGETYPALPTTGVTLVYELADGSTALWVMFLRVEAELLAELTVFRPPYSPPASPR